MSKNSLIKDLTKTYKPEVKLIFKRIDLKEVKQPVGLYHSRV